MAEKKTVQEAIKEILQLRGKEIFKNIKRLLTTLVLMTDQKVVRFIYLTLKMYKIL